MMTWQPSRLKFLSFAHSVMQWTTPWPVASARPCEPPAETLLPVTTPRTVLRSLAPAMFMYVSIIQTMVWLLVLTSGAGMSRSGPMFVPSAAVKRRVLARVELDAALTTAERNLVERALVRHPRCERLHLVEVRLVVIAHAALVQAEDVVVLNAIALEHLEAAAVAPHREVHDQLVLRLPEDLGDVLLDVDQLHRLLDQLRRDLEEVAAILQGYFGRLRRRASGRRRCCSAHCG